MCSTQRQIDYGPTDFSISRAPSINRSIDQSIVGLSRFSVSLVVGLVLSRLTDEGGQRKKCAEERAAASSSSSPHIRPPSRDVINSTDRWRRWNTRRSPRILLAVESSQPPDALSPYLPWPDARCPVGDPVIPSLIRPAHPFPLDRTALAAAAAAAASSSARMVRVFSFVHLFAAAAAERRLRASGLTDSRPSKQSSILTNHRSTTYPPDTSHTHPTAATSQGRPTRATRASIHTYEDAAAVDCSGAVRGAACGRGRERPAGGVRGWVGDHGIIVCMYSCMCVCGKGVGEGIDRVGRSMDR